MRYRAWHSLARRGGAVLTGPVCTRLGPRLGSCATSLSTLNSLPTYGGVSAVTGCPVTHAAGEASSRPQGRREGPMGLAPAHTWSPGSGDFARCSEHSPQVGPGSAHLPV